MSDNQDKYVKIIEGIAEIKGTVGSIREDLSTVKDDVHKNTKDLEVHIAGVKTAQARLSVEIETRKDLFKERDEKYEAVEKRLQDVEFIPNFIKSMVKLSKWTAAIGGAILVVTRIAGLW